MTALLSSGRPRGPRFGAGRRRHGFIPTSPTTADDRDRGFTLVEVMIAVVMLSVGVLALAQVFAVANQHTSFAREQSAATCLAEEIREKIMSAEYDDVYTTFNLIDTNTPSSVPAAAAEWADHLRAELGAYGRGQVQVDTEDTDPALAHGMLGITVTISWREGFGMTSLPLRFAMAKTGA